MPARFILVLNVMFLLFNFQAAAQQAVEPPPCYIGELRVGKAPDGSTTYECAMSKKGGIDFHLCTNGTRRSGTAGSPFHVALPRAEPSGRLGP